MTACLCPWARYCVSIALLTWVHQRGICCGKYYNLSADKVCTWPVVPLGEAKWLWRFSRYRNDRQQRSVSCGKRHYTNADIIIRGLLLFKCHHSTTLQCAVFCHTHFSFFFRIILTEVFSHSPNLDKLGYKMARGCERVSWFFIFPQMRFWLISVINLKLYLFIKEQNTCMCTASAQLGYYTINYEVHG